MFKEARRKPYGKSNHGLTSKVKTKRGQYRPMLEHDNDKTTSSEGQISQCLKTCEDTTLISYELELNIYLQDILDRRYKSFYD